MPPGLDLAFLSGIAIGLFFLALARTSPDAGLWPLLASRSLCLVVFGGYVMVTAGTLRLSQPVLGMTLWCGVIDMLANACYVLATHGGSLSIIVTLASLYPASTVVLARLVVGERLSRIQAAGMFCALVAVVLIVSSS